jgi:hypothetical protein
VALQHAPFVLASAAVFASLLPSVRRRPWWLFAITGLFLQVVLFVRWSSKLTFYWDEWTILNSLAYNDFTYWLLQKHMGHVFPLGKLVYGIEILWFKNHYVLYVFTNAALHTVNGYLLYRLLARVAPFWIAVLSGLVYVVGFYNVYDLVWGMQIIFFVAINLTLLAVTIYWHNEYNWHRHLSWLLLAAATFTFSMSLLGFAWLAIVILISRWINDRAPLVPRSDLTAFVVVASLTAAGYLLLSSLSFDRHLHAGANVSTLRGNELGELKKVAFHLDIFKAFGLVSLQCLVPVERSSIAAALLAVLCVGIVATYGSAWRKLVPPVVGYAVGFITLLYLIYSKRSHFGAQILSAERYFPYYYVLLLTLMAVLAGRAPEGNGRRGFFTVALAGAFCLQVAQTALATSGWQQTRMQTFAASRTALEYRRHPIPAGAQVAIPELNPELTYGQLAHIHETLFGGLR